MGLRYVIGNLINDNTTINRSSEDTLYVKENLYNERPSLPFRTTAKGAQWVCADFGEDTEVTFVGIFNHNLTTGPTLQLCGGNACEVCTCVTDMTDAPADPCGDGCGTQPTADFRNTWSKVDCEANHQCWTLKITDTPDEDYYEIGEWVLGRWREFPKGILDAPGEPWVRLSPGRADGPEFFMGNQRTHYGQDWSTYYSECERFELTFTNQNDPCVRDAIHVFLSDVQQTGGRFILIPDDTKSFCYYVIIDNLRDYADRLIYGRTRELREWRLRLKTLTEGVRLL
ncbi:hypothetical protein ES703_72672 [subsurface metagenome]